MESGGVNVTHLNEESTSKTPKTAACKEGNDDNSVLNTNVENVDEVAVRTDPDLADCPDEVRNNFLLPFSKCVIMTNISLSIAGPASIIRYSPKKQQSFFWFELHHGKESFTNSIYSEHWNFKSCEKC
jgi:hypothetical protein